MSVLSFHNVSLAYPSRGGDGKRVLDGIDLRIASGEFIAVIGRSGSGKTSLLNLAAGFIAPTEGEIRLDGAPVTGPGAERAVVFQDDALYPWLDARGNVAFPLRLKGVGKAERLERAEELLTLVDLAGAGRKRIWELSGGMRQRVGIARALAAEPRFLLLDEPLGALDALTRARMQSLLLKVWAASATGVLLITHSIDEALLLATRVLVVSPEPGKPPAALETGFGREALQGRPLAAIKADPAFRRLHDELTGLIHETSDEEFAA